MMARMLQLLAAAYLGAGLSLALIMAQVLPLTPLGIAAYTATWPRHVYCARPGADCFGMADYLPFWIGVWLFDVEGAE